MAAYIHGAYRMGVLVGFNKDAGEAGKDIAMQIAAMNPIAVDADSVPAETIAREKDIAIEQVKAEGKPAEMAEKIAMGKINKFFKESTLLAQPFVKDSNKSVADYLKSIDPDLKVVSLKELPWDNRINFIILLQSCHWRLFFLRWLFQFFFF